MESKDEKKLSESYPLMILQIKLWEWIGIKDRMETSIAKDGPCQETAEAFETSVHRIKELQDAINIIKHQP